MLKNIANINLVIEHSAGSLVSGGTFTIVSTPSTKVDAEGKVYFGDLVFTFTGGSHDSGVGGTAVGGGTISPTAVKVKSGMAVIRVDDDGDMTGTYTLSANPPVPLTPFTSSVEITDAGQEKVKAQ